MSSPVLGRRVSKSISCDNRRKLVAACCMTNQEIVVANVLKPDGNEEENKLGEVTAIFWRFHFHDKG